MKHFKNEKQENGNTYYIGKFNIILIKFDVQISYNHFYELLVQNNASTSKNIWNRNIIYSNRNIFIIKRKFDKPHLWLGWILITVQIEEIDK